MLHLRVLIVSLALTAVLPILSAQDSSPRDEVLWQQIEAMRRTVPASLPFEQRAQIELQRARALCDALGKYLTLYPGGTHRDDAIRIELEKLFEIGSLTSGDYSELAARVESYLQNPPSGAAKSEAAYWQLICAFANETGSPTTRPASGPGLPERPDAQQLREYLRQFPDSRRAPRLATLVCNEAERRGDVGEMRAAFAALAAAFPEHATTADLRGRLARLEAVGGPFSVELIDAEGQRVDSRQWLGRPVLIVVWGSFRAAALECVRAVEAYRRAHDELVVLGVNLDESREDMTAACSRLGIAWPQMHHGMGWANEFVRKWGVRQVPFVFVVDRSGNLLGGVGSDWKMLAEEAVVKNRDKAGGEKPDNSAGPDADARKQR